jgi:hypothetical protein
MSDQKKTLNGWVDAVVVERWRQFSPNLRGNQGDKLACALIALQALWTLDPELPVMLMRRRITIEQAADLIREAILQAAERTAKKELGPLPDEVLEPLLRRAAQALREADDESSHR